MTDIHVVTDHLRSALEEECSQLKRDIRFLQESLEDECKYRDDVKSTQPPSLKGEQVNALHFNVYWENAQN
eukprot:m.99143 g.99143  ORF g.99143 m.99143 type:complete len:71 (+) comp37041_c0_seq4:110-322(+)